MYKKRRTYIEIEDGDGNIRIERDSPLYEYVTNIVDADRKVEELQQNVTEEQGEALGEIRRLLDDLLLRRGRIITASLEYSLITSDRKKEFIDWMTQSDMSLIEQIESITEPTSINPLSFEDRVRAVQRRCEKMIENTAKEKESSEALNVDEIIARMSSGRMEDKGGISDKVAVDLKKQRINPNSPYYDYVATPKTELEFIEEIRILMDNVQLGFGVKDRLTTAMDSIAYKCQSLEENRRNTYHYARYRGTATPYTYNDPNDNPYISKVKPIDEKLVREFEEIRDILQQGSETTSQLSYDKTQRMLDLAEVNITQFLDRSLGIGELVEQGTREYFTPYKIYKNAETHYQSKDGDKKSWVDKFEEWSSDPEFRKKIATWATVIGLAVTGVTGLVMMEQEDEKYPVAKPPIIPPPIVQQAETPILDSTPIVEVVEEKDAVVIPDCSIAVESAMRRTPKELKPLLVDALHKGDDNVRGSDSEYIIYKEGMSDDDYIRAFYTAYYESLWTAENVEEMNVGRVYYHMGYVMETFACYDAYLTDRANGVYRDINGYNVYYATSENGIAPSSATLQYSEDGERHIIQNYDFDGGRTSIREETIRCSTALAVLSGGKNGRQPKTSSVERANESERVRDIMIESGDLIEICLDYHLEDRTLPTTRLRKQDVTKAVKNDSMSIIDVVNEMKYEAER